MHIWYILQVNAVRYCTLIGNNSLNTSETIIMKIFIDGKNLILLIIVANCLKLLHSISKMLSGIKRVEISCGALGIM